ncbi:MAG: HIT domain-containing protein [Deltaproteobacteria bacterium]|nr:HIT domain-containing protein [Deltaproteobacteria bacterium]
MLRDDCPICRRFQGQEPDPGGALIETSLVRAQHASVPEGRSGAHAGWLLVTPLRHVTSLAELTDDEAREMGIVRTRLATALLDSTAEHVYSTVIGDQVPHVHEHVIARWPDTPQEYHGPFKLLEWPGAHVMANEGIRLFCDRLRDRLLGH